MIRDVCLENVHILAVQFGDNLFLRSLLVAHKSNDNVRWIR